MSFESMLATEGGPVVVVIPAQTVDRDSNTILDWDNATRATVQGLVQQTSTTLSTPGRDAVVTGFKAFLEPAAAPTDNCRLEVDGTYAADGKPRLLHRHGVPHHWEFPVKEVKG